MAIFSTVDRVCVCVGVIGNLATLVLMDRALSTVANSWWSFASQLPLPTPFSDRALDGLPLSLLLMDWFSVHEGHLGPCFTDIRYK